MFHFLAELWELVQITGSNKKEGDPSPMIYNTAFACHFITNCMYFSVLEVGGVSWDDHVICWAHWDISESGRWPRGDADRLQSALPGADRQGGHVCVGVLPGTVLLQHFICWGLSWVVSWQPGTRAVAGSARTWASPGRVLVESLPFLPQSHPLALFPGISVRFFSLFQRIFLASRTKPTSTDVQKLLLEFITWK